MTGFIYLASPYTHENPHVMEKRYRAALAATKYLLQQRMWVFSPIVHCHHLALEGNMPKDAHFWEEYDFAMLRKADSLLILRIEGTDQSRGVANEKAEAERLGIPWRYL